MNFSLRATICLAILITLSSSLFAKKYNWDKVLDRYEYICEQCANLKAKVAAGGKVSKRKVDALVDELGTLRHCLNDASGSMTPRQRERFERIRSRYPGVFRDARQGNTLSAASAAVSHSEPEEPGWSRSSAPEIKTVYIRDTIETIIEKPVKRIEYPAVEHIAYYIPDSAVVASSTVDCGSVSCGPLRPEVVRRKLRTEDFGLLLQCGAIPDFDIGVMAYCSEHYGPWGVYTSYRNDFQPVNADYSFSSSSAQGSQVWTTGKSARHRMSISGGALLKTGDALTLYSGLGYGEFQFGCEDVVGKWVELSDYSCRGLGCECGILLRKGSFVLGAGISATSFRYCELTVSAGLQL